MEEGKLPGNSWSMNIKTSKDRISGPCGVTVSSELVIYISDTHNDKIKCFDSNGNFICKWGRAGNGNGEFRNPYSLIIGPNVEMRASITSAIQSVPELSSYPWRSFNNLIGSVLVTGMTPSSESNSLGLSVALENCNLNSLRSSERSSGSKSPSGIISICVDYIGTECLYVVDKVFDISDMLLTRQKPKFIRKWGSRGDGDGCNVLGDLIFISDYIEGRIQVFDYSGKFICKWVARHIYVEELGCQIWVVYR